MMENEYILSGFAPSPASSAAPGGAVEGIEAPGIDLPVDVPVEGSWEVVVVDELIDRLIEIVGQEQEYPNFVETPLAHYSTTDGLLLLLLVVSFASLLWSAIKGGK